MSGLRGNVGCIGYADDLAILSSDAFNTQVLMNIAYTASCKWRFDFSIKKCAVLKFGGNPTQDMFYLGPDAIITSDSYNHLGVTIYARGRMCITDIKKNISSCKRAFYSTLGQSLYKTNLSPLSLSKVYWSVAVPKLLGNAEARHFSSLELKEYESFHLKMAKDIQNLPCNSPNATALASLGWRSISMQIDYLRLMFIHRLFLLQSSSMHSVFVIRRLIYIMLSGVYRISPLVLAIETCMKYDLAQVLVGWLNTGLLPSKNIWKSFINHKLDDIVHCNWRFELSISHRLQFYRAIHISYQAIVWWKFAQKLPFLKKPCCTMLRLLCGTNILAINVKMDVMRSLRYCMFCTGDHVEDLLHFVMVFNEGSFDS